MTPPKPATLVIGIGNPYRSDDAAGLMVARLLKKRSPSSCRVYEHSGEGTSLMELWAGADLVIVVDAVRAGDSPGAVNNFDAAHGPLPAKMYRDSTHTFGLVEAVELSRALNQLPRKLVVYGIEGRDFAAGTTLSPAVELAINHVVEDVLQELDGYKCGSSD